jgi:hypothetical protein
MRIRICSLFFLLFLTVSMVGCDGGDAVPEDAPPTPEPGTSDYDQYNSGSRENPGAAPEGN